jgi:prolyl oligopeptidase
MIATARYLIAAGYTSPQHLAVRGTSAGGIAVGGAVVQHPELFAAAVDNVGMTNILRFQQTEVAPRTFRNLAMSHLRPTSLICIRWTRTSA